MPPLQVSLLAHVLLCLQVTALEQTPQLCITIYYIHVSAFVACQCICSTPVLTDNLECAELSTGSNVYATQLCTEVRNAFCDQSACNNKP